ncbi:MAG: S41 family peptidase [Gammaproteobacteria bacterium]|nr:S41 family peptidase [Gammaproteobacteria bacterium]
MNRHTLLLLAIGTLGITTAFAQTAMEPAPDDAATVTAPIEPESLPLDELRLFTEVLHRIKRDYVEPIDDRTLLEHAIRGMLAGLDPHSSYLNADDYAGLQEGTTGEFGGLGIEVSMEDGYIRVIAPIDDTPAARAGVQAGDLIIRLDETPVKGLSLNDAIERMRGAPGSEIELTISREGVDTPLTLRIVRDIVRVASVRGRLLEPGYGYLRIATFQARTGSDLRDHLLRLQGEGGGLYGVILDLRNNPGGVLGAAVEVADAFLERGEIVHTGGRAADSSVPFNAKPPDLLKGAPLIVLVNEGSASASEIVAGALQDRKRAVIVGRKTFGKGSVQTILPISNESALKLTTALYFTPAGRSIQAEGIKPDIVIDKLRVAAQEASPTEVKEADLARHLDNTTVPSPPAATAEPPANTVLAKDDFELFEALNLLKAMALMQHRANAEAE